MMNVGADDLICSTCGQGFCTFIDDRKIPALETKGASQLAKQNQEEEKKQGDDFNGSQINEHIFGELLFNGPPMQRQGTMFIDSQDSHVDPQRVSEEIEIIDDDDNDDQFRPPKV